ncbi:MAG: serine/threonine-protein kinase [Myxococcota bacterium]
MGAPSVISQSHIGRYEVVGPLARGGMAELFLCRLHGPSGFERPVVVKRILPHLAARQDFVDMFLDEGRLTARIRHRNVVQVQELVQDQDELFQVMEYLEGESVSGLLRRLRLMRCKLDVRLAAHIVSEACAGLHAAHELTTPEGEPIGLVHRDISPDNLFVGYDGAVKVLDFGIAKGSTRLVRTETGTIKGKFSYMSPEQTDGQALDRRSDVFALGIVLYELLTQHALYRRRSPAATIKAITNERVAPPSSINPRVPQAFDALCLRALAKDPDARFATARDVRLALIQGLRALDEDEPLEDAMATLMRDIFEDRVAEKSQMLARVRRGERDAVVLPANVDDNVELPSIVDAGPSTPIASTPPEHTPVSLRSAQPEPRKGRLALGAAALIGCATAGFAAWALPSDDGSAVQPAVEQALADRNAGASESDAVARPVPVEPPEVRDTVTLSIVSRRGAQIEVDGELRGVAPLEVTVPRGEPVTIAARSGRRSTERRVRPETDLEVELAFPRRRPPATMSKQSEPNIIRW